METPQHGIGPKKIGNEPKMNFFEAFPVFSKMFGNPSNLIFWGVSHFLWSVSLIIRSDSGLYGSYIFEGFPNIFDPFPHFLGPFPVFRKSFKILVCWSVSPFFWVRFLFFWVRFRFSEKVLHSQKHGRFYLGKYKDWINYEVLPCILYYKAKNLWTPCC